MSRTKAGAAKWLLASSACLMAGCASPPDLGAPPAPAAAEDYAIARSTAAPAAAWPSDRWWETYGDQALGALIGEALADSPSLEAAAARVRQARAAAQQAGAARAPRVSGSASVEAARHQLSDSGAPEAIRDVLPDDWATRSSASLKLDYQLDFFGRNRAAFAAAGSRAAAAEAEAAAARLQLSTAVALAYADLLRLYAERGAAEDSVRVRQESATLVQQRVRAGLENEGEAHQAEAETARALAGLVAVDGDIARTRHALAALLGKGPDRGLAIDIPARPRIAPPGLPARLELDLAGRRPDLVAARLRAEAAAARIKVARADFYPNVNIAALVGIQSLSLEGLDGGELSFAQAGPALSLPIFDGGRVEGVYRAARAEYDEAVALYDEALANALREIADALADRRTLDARLAHERAALNAAEAAYRIARLRYRGGLMSYIDTLSIESSLVAQRRAVAELEARAFALDVTMVRALGGGFVAS